jgi:hypothetical protein
MNMGGEILDHPQAAPTVPRQRNTQTPPVRLGSYDRRYAAQRLHTHSTVCHRLVQGLTPSKSESVPVRVSLPASEQISQSTAMEETICRALSLVDLRAATRTRPSQ